MAENSGFWPDINGDREYNHDFLRKWVASFISNGVYYSELEVLPGDAFNVVLQPGRAWINGVKYENDSPLNIDLTPAANVAGLNRYTSIMLRSDINGRIINAIPIDSTPTAEPIPIIPTRNSELYDLKLCDIYIQAGAISVSKAIIDDTRTETELCGIVTNILGSFDTSQLYAQMQAIIEEFEQEYKADLLEWFESLVDIIDENAAAHLLLLINQNREIIDNLTPSALATKEENSISITSTAAKIGENYSVQFDAPTDFDANDTYNIDGTPTALKSINGDDINDAWKEGAPITLVRRGGNAFFNSGGNPLKIRVRGGLTAPANGRDGDIWVKTDYPLSGRVIIGYHGLSTLPRVAGDVYLALNATCTPGTPLQSMAGSAKLKLLSMITGLCYWDGAALVRKVGFRVWANGAWAQPFPYFYNAGIDYLGDFGIIGTVTAYVDTTTVYVASGYWSTSQWAAAGLSGGIETGNLKSVQFNFLSGAVGYQGTCWVSMMSRPIRGGGHIGTFGSINGASSGNTTFSVLSSNVETAEGIGYPCIGINGGNTGGLTGFRLSSIVPTYL